MLVAHIFSSHCMLFGSHFTSITICSVLLLNAFSHMYVILSGIITDSNSTVSELLRSFNISASRPLDACASGLKTLSAIHTTFFS